MRPKVSVVKVDDVERSVRRAVNLIGGLPDIIESRSKVLIKPNLFPPGVDFRTGANVNPLVVSTLIRELKSITEDITIVESNFGGGWPSLRDLDKVYKLPQYDMLSRSGARLLNLSKDAGRRVEMPEAKVLDGFSFPETILDADAIVNVAVVKVHHLTTVTLGIKNLYGLIPDPSKRENLHGQIDDVLCDLAGFFKPVLTVLDGSVGMEGGFSPCFGVSARFGVIVAGYDLVSTDAVCSYLMGYNPSEIRRPNPIWKAHLRGLGTADLGQIEIVGEDAQSLRRRFDLDKDLPMKILSKLQMVKKAAKDEILAMFPGGERLVERYLETMSRDFSIIAERGDTYVFDKDLLNDFFCIQCGQCPAWKQL